MTVVRLYHDREPSVEVTSVDQMDRILDQITDTPRFRTFPVFVSLEDEHRRYTLQLGLGRTDLSTLVWYDADGDIAASRGTVAYDERPRFTFGGTPTDAYDHSAVPVAMAREAARQFFATGRRPTCVEWQEPAYSPEGESSVAPVGGDPT